MDYECSCNPETFPFYCERHKCVKTRRWRQLCKTRPDYRELWGAGHGPGQAVDPTALPRRKSGPPLEERIRAFIQQKAEELERKFSKCKGLCNTGRRYRTLEQALACLETCRQCDQFRVDVELCGLIKGCGRTETYRHQLTSVGGKCPDGRWDSI